MIWHVDVTASRNNEAYHMLTHAVDDLVYATTNAADARISNFFWDTTYADYDV